MLLHFIIFVDFSRIWFLVVSFVRNKVPSWMQILGLMLSERSEGSSAELGTSCCALSVHLHLGNLLLYAVNVCVLGPSFLPRIAGRLGRTQGT